MEVFEDVDSGITKKYVALKFGIPENSLSIIIINREAILKQSEIVVHYSTGRKWLKISLYDDVDEAVL